ncbi:MAG: hypothetical protein M3O30_15510, partial [Planctomycetota bacterium]|nr:hypothetical protein [Planctomycetota bacterium]
FQECAQFRTDLIVLPLQLDPVIAILVLSGLGAGFDDVHEPLTDLRIFDANLSEERKELPVDF